MFVRCHENYLVNPEYVSRISRYRIELTYGKVIPISEKNYTAVKTKLSHIT
ncbi:LytTR family transcriptional regulator DNA-binding domain-containing protein [Ruminococcus sp. AM31-15AC]|uniref:LytTR family transcriptional regulator DNA-binding domain-containing protein n=2 Tax=Ruminococcus TaxID=1263 RepID=UPI0036F3FAC3